MFIFPMLTFIFLTLGFYRRYASRLLLREAFLLAAVAWGIILVLLTESLSAYQLLSFPYLSVFWILMTLDGLIFCVFLPADKMANAAAFDLKKKIFSSLASLHSVDVVMLVMISLVLFFVGVTAFVAPPNNWDSLVYHMARVGHWVQNRSIAHYPTNIKTQIYYPPFAEWVILHFQILCGLDRFANMVQWFALLGSAVAASATAKILGAGRTGQIFCALLTVTVPMAIVQGSSTQNDLVLSFWLITFVYFGLRAKDSGKPLDVFAMGGALGLALLTKALASILAFSFIVWFFISGIRKQRFKIIRLVVFAGLLVAAINANHLLRNSAVSGHVLGEDEVFGITRNQRMTPAFFMSNVVRNIGLHLGTSIKSLNRLSEKAIVGFHQGLGVNNIEPAISLGDQPLVVQVSTHEDIAGNFIQLLLIMTTIIFFFTRPRDKGWWGILKYLFALLGSVMMFSLLLKWQPAGARLHLPIFILFGPFVTMALFSLPRSKGWIIYGVIAILVATATPYIFRNSSRKLFSSKKTIFSTPRLQQYFSNDENIFLAYQAVVAQVKTQNCDQVGLWMKDNYWEYPLWVLFGQEPRLRGRIEQVGTVGVQPPDYPAGPFSPCVVISVGPTLPADGKVKINGKRYSLTLDEGIAKVLLPL